MEGSLIIQGLTLDEFQSVFATLIKQIVKDEIQQALASQQEDRLLSIEETCKLFVPAITRQTLRNWTSQGLIQSHTIGRSVFYKYSEIIGAAKSVNRIIRTPYKSAA